MLGGSGPDHAIWETETMRALTRLVLFLSGLTAPVYAQDTELEIVRIEALVSGARDFAIFQELGDIPTDVVDAFRLTVQWDRMAEWGEPWNQGDIEFGDVPTRQHVFSAVSPTVAVVVFRQGGWGLRTTVVVAERNTPGLCVYDAGDWIPNSINAIRGSIADSTEPGWVCKYRAQ